MAGTKRVNSILEKMGFEPQEGRAIIVTYAPENLSDRVRRFFWNQYYMLSFCRDSLVLVRFNMLADLKKEAALELPFSSIRSVNVSEDGFNYRIDIQLEDEVISLSAQQAELSELRSSGYYSMGITDFDYYNNWHRKNLKETLESLKSFGRTGKGGFNGKEMHRVPAHS